MVRGPKKHLKRIAAPKHWMLDKLGGAYTVRPTAGPHKLRECLPLVLLLRNRLKYALTRREVMYIAVQRLVKVDGKVRTDPRFPTGFMDVVSLEKTGEHFRLLYDEKGRFTVHRITPQEARFKLCRVTKMAMGRGNERQPHDPLPRPQDQRQRHREGEPGDGQDHGLRPL